MSNIQPKSHHPDPIPFSNFSRFTPDGTLASLPPIVSKSADIPQFLTVKQVASTLGVSRQTVYNLINDGRLLAGRLTESSSFRIRYSDLQAFIVSMFGAPHQAADQSADPSYVPEHLRPAVTTPADIDRALAVCRAASDATPAIKVQKVTSVFRADGTRDIAAEARQVARNRAALGKPPLRIVG